MKAMNNQRGFTVFEAIVVLVFLFIGAWLFFSQKATADAVVRDDQRKVAINAMYYSLEEVFYEKNQYYPLSIDSKTLRAVDPTLFTDPNGYKLGESMSNYQYEGQSCTVDNKCEQYRLSSDMELEAEYVKTNRRNN